MPITPNDPEYQDIMRRHRDGKKEERAKAKRKDANMRRSFLDKRRTIK